MSDSREAVEAAFDEHEEEPIVEEPIVEEPIVEAVATPDIPIGEAVIEEQNIDQPFIEEPIADQIKAPASWSASAREVWGNLDPIAQAEVNKREAEINQALTTTGEARKHYEEFNQTVSPFEGLMRAEGATPMQAVQTLLGTAATLQTGSPQAKAERIAGLIQHYGVDLRTLDSLLAGEMPEDNSMSQFESMLNQRMAPMNEFLNQQQNQQQQFAYSQQQEANTEWETFKNTHDFATDLQTEMADWLTMAAQKGQSMTIDQAYEKAIMMNPEIQQIIQQRKSANEASAQSKKIRQKEGASVSMRGGGAMQQGAPAPQSRREALEQAWGE